MFKIIKFFSFFVNFDQHSRINIKIFKNKKKMNLITRQRKFIKHVDEYINKINVINVELRTQIIWTQIKQKRFVNVYQVYNFK